jgi:hypothetical protein
MNDKELLELAAKAAGIADGNVLWDFDQGKEWRPLTDDGDALRLAVNLNITIKVYGGNAMCYDIADNFLADWVDAEYPYAATRRAIVRAAAAIGKEMP